MGKPLQVGAILSCLSIVSLQRLSFRSTNKTLTKTGMSHLAIETQEGSYLAMQQPKDDKIGMRSW